MLKKISLFLLMTLSLAFAQSNETGQVFNEYSGADDGVDLFSGTSSITKKLVSINSGKVSTSLELKYSGNVSEVVSNKNDVAPTSWVGLGWSLGHAKIVCNPAGTIWTGDDSYKLVSASGVHYNIYKEGKDDNGEDKWWIASLPYWSIKPMFKEGQYGKNKMTVVVGWELHDEVGNTYHYGDGDSDFFVRNATEYTIAYPYSTGIVGVIDDGKDVPYPVAWNLKKVEDYDGNYVIYSYDQHFEYVAKRSSTKKNPKKTTNSYTKETYLKDVVSSQGTWISFVTEKKDYENEFLDTHGTNEQNDEDFDAFIDPLERRYLSQIIVRQKAKELSDNDVNKLANHRNWKSLDAILGDYYEIVRRFDFCYKPLNTKFEITKNSIDSEDLNSIDDSKYVKRLLTSVVESSNEGEIQKDLYTYYEKTHADDGSALNFGALRSVKGGNCGSIEYEYSEQSVAKIDSKTGLHQELLPVANATIGTLKDGTTYLVGFNRKNKSYSDYSVEVYFRKNDKWVLQQNLSKDYSMATDLVKYSSDGYFITGSGDWFVYVEKFVDEAGDKYSHDVTELTYHPFVWNGKYFESHTTITETDDDANYIAVGPGYIVKARVADERIKVTIPWAFWGSDPNDVIYEAVADDDKDDREARIFTSYNHFGFSYRSACDAKWNHGNYNVNCDVDPGGLNDGRLIIFSFDPERKPVKTLDQWRGFDKNDWNSGLGGYFVGGLDDDNHYAFLNDHILICAVESSVISDQELHALYFTEGDDANHTPTWKPRWITHVDGWQGYLSIMAMGEDYVLVRHDDNDDLTLVSFDGHNWKKEVDGRNMVHNQHFDPKTEAEWDAIPGNDFFVVRRPEIIKHFYGNAVRPQREYQLFKRKNNKWTTSKNLGSGNRKHIYAGENWFYVKELDSTYINNGEYWYSSLLSSVNNGGKSAVSQIKDNDDVRSLHGNLLAYESFDGTYVIVKKRGSFTDDYGAFFVTKKIVDDPVTDKKVEYSYEYHTTSLINKEYPTYNYMTMSPEVHGVTIILPESAGKIEKSLCDYDDGRAKGSVCSERFYYKSNYTQSSVDRVYERYNGNGKWPLNVYVDRLKSVSSTKNLSIRKEEYFYEDLLNGLVNKVVFSSQGKNVLESNYIYAAKDDSGMKNAHRLTEVVANYECSPNCESPKKVSGSAIKFKPDEKGVVRATGEYSFNQKNEINSIDGKFSFSWNPTNFGYWQKNKTMSNFYRGVPMETEDRFGVKSAVVLESNESGRAQVNVTNAGLDQILVFPGDACVEQNWSSCNIVTLSGRYFEDSNEDALSYGRFSNKAVLIPGYASLFGTIKNAKKGKYRFSAWVQAVSPHNNPNNLQIFTNNLSKNFALSGDGAWDYIEWITDFDLEEGSSYNLSLASSNNTDIRLQDVRFVPEDALVSVQFWDRLWNVPTALSNDRGVGTFFTLDAQGRTVKTYGETVDRNIFLKSKTTYMASSCGVPGANIALKSLKINGIDVPISNVPNTVDITVENNTDELDVTWETLVEGERVFYKLEKAGDSKDFKEDCCASSKQLKQDFEGLSMVLSIAVSSENNPYIVKIHKSTTGWIDYGGVLGKGDLPSFWSKNDVSGAYFWGDEELKRAHFDGSDWHVYFEGGYERLESIGSLVNAGKNYVFVLPDFGDENSESSVDNLKRPLYVNKNAQSLYTNIQSFASKNGNVLTRRGKVEDGDVVSRLYKVASNNTNTVSYMVYEKTTYVEDENFPEIEIKNEEERKRNEGRTYINRSKSLVAQKLQGINWYDEGVVIDSEIDDVDLAVGKNDIPYVAFIGAVASQNVERIVIDDPDGLYDDCVSLSEIPEDKVHHYTERVFNVVVKHLNDKGNWVGYNSIDGDVLSVEGLDGESAKKLKIASDGSDLYMAVLFEKSDESERSLKVYKLNIENKTMTFKELVDNISGSSVIAYLNEYDNFALSVSGGVPYIAFSNEANEERLTVLSFESGRWLSVGRPAFGSISNDEYSLDFTTVKNTSSEGPTPYVLFKESEYSSNAKRRGAVVPMMYSSVGDKNLTLLSVENKPYVFNDFRQYILNYRTTVSEDVEKITLNLNLAQVKDVAAVRVINNGKDVFVWRNLKSFWSFLPSYEGKLSSVNISLEKGANSISIQIFDKDSKSLTYRFVITRKYTKPLSARVSGNGGYFATQIVDGSYVDGESIISVNSSSSSSVTALAKKTFVVEPSDDGSSEVGVCFEHSSGWRAYVGDQVYYGNVCVNYDYEEQKIIWSSSSSYDNSGEVNGSSSSGIKSDDSQIIFVNEDGKLDIVDLVVQPRSSSSGYPEVEGVNNAKSSSSCTGKGCVGNFSSSSSCSVQGCDSDDGNSSSSVIEYKEPYGDVVKGTAVPADFLPLLDYKFIGGEKIGFANNVSVMTGQYAAGYIDVAAEAKIYGSLKSTGNVFVGSNAYVNTLVVGGASTIQQGARIDNLLEENMTVPAVPHISFSYGEENVNVTSEKSIVVYPGDYENINVFANAKVTFETGVYRIKSLYIAPDASVTLNTDKDLIQIWVQEGVSIGDRTVFKSTGGATKVFIYGNGQNTMYIGVDANVDANVAYPNGNIELAPKSSLSGSAWAKIVTVGANAVVK